MFDLFPTTHHGRAGMCASLWRSQSSSLGQSGPVTRFTAIGLQLSPPLVVELPSQTNVSVSSRCPLRLVVVGDSTDNSCRTVVGPILTTAVVVIFSVAPSPMDLTMLVFASWLWKSF